VGRVVVVWRCGGDWREEVEREGRANMGKKEKIKFGF